MSRNHAAVLALLVLGGCSSHDLTGPAASVRGAGAPTADRSSAASPMIVVPYEKWITAFPAMAGNADGVLGAFTGTILQRVVSADGMTVHLRASYTIENTHRRGHSFTAVVEGDQNLRTMTAVLTGAVTEGWKAGAPVLVNFQVLTPCTVPTAPPTVRTCFKGTIRIAHSPNADEDDSQ